MRDRRADSWPFNSLGGFGGHPLPLTLVGAQCADDPKGQNPMSTYRSFECATGLTADRELRAAFVQRVGIEPSPMTDGHKRLSLVQELPME